MIPLFPPPFLPLELIPVPVIEQAQATSPASPEKRASPNVSHEIIIPAETLSLTKNDSWAIGLIVGCRQ
jgi:hypothetical protein